MADDETDARIVLSRNTLAWYRWMGQTPDLSHNIVDAEIAVLEGIATTHPMKAVTLGKLVFDWRRVMTSAE